VLHTLRDKNSPIFMNFFRTY